MFLLLEPNECRGEDIDVFFAGKYLGRTSVFIVQFPPIVVEKRGEGGVNIRFV
jgi:hypothetical protein